VPARQKKTPAGGAGVNRRMGEGLGAETRHRAGARRALRHQPCGTRSRWCAVLSAAVGEEPSYSFLGTREEFLELLASVGFTKIDCRNETSEGSERPLGELTPATILAADMPERQANAARSGKEGRLVRIFVIAQRPS
jgi:hypothetical protein